SVSIAAVPEPATWALFILGFGAIGTALRRKASRRVALRFA
ncbi:MAG: PEP-CTERM sorting domain-containing protein, partial [Sphingomonadales bacterium]